MERIAELLASEDEWRGRLRAVGGLLLGAGLVLVFLRRVYTFDPWGDLALFGVLALAFVLVYGAGALAARTAPDRHPWQGTLMIFGVFVLPLALFQLLRALDGDTGAALNIAWIFLLTAIAGGWAAAAGARYGAFLAALALVVSWLALWDAILATGVFGESGTLRALLVVIGVALLAGGAAARLFGGAAGSVYGAEVLTSGAVAAVAAGAISFDAYLSWTVIADFAATPTTFWNGYLLVASLAAIVLAIALRIRGIAYAGAIGLAVFIVVVGFDLRQTTPTGDLVGWPLVMLVLGLGAILASLVRVVELPEDAAAKPADGEGEAAAETERPPRPDESQRGQD